MIVLGEKIDPTELVAQAREWVAMPTARAQPLTSLRIIEILAAALEQAVKEQS